MRHFTLRRFSALAVSGAVGATVASRPVCAQTVTPPSPTRSLYHFQRDDAATVTTIHIDPAQTGRTPISQNIFGNFIEHLGNVIYDALWDNLLLNPSVEPIDKDAPMPERWQWSGGAAWADGGYLSPRAVRLVGANAELWQNVSLQTARERKYTLTFYARPVPGARIGKCVVSLRVAPDGPTLCTSPITVSGAEFQKQTVSWQVAPGALPVGQAVRFMVQGVDGGAAAGQTVGIDVDQFQFFPDDAQDGMDPQTLKKAREWNAPILRLAGNFSSGYHWRDGVGPRLARPTQRNVAWGGGIETNHFGTDEFFDLARRMGNVPAQIAVNAGDGTPAEAADWVRYCEQHHDPVAVWEIGNELYGGWQIGHTDAAGNADRYVRFRVAMLAADPKLTLMATGKGDEFQPDGLVRDRDWNTTVLRGAVANSGKAPDYLTIHPLVALPSDLNGRPYAEQWESAMAHPAFMDATLLPELIGEIRAVEGPTARTHIAPTEWGIIVGGDNWRQSPDHDAESGAVYSALALDTFLRNSDWVTLANATALLHGGCIKRSHGVVYVDPQYWTLKLFADAKPTAAVRTDVSGPARDVPARGFLPAVAAVPDVDVFAALAADGKHLDVFLVNRTLADARPVHIDAGRYSLDRAKATLLTAADPQTGNSWDKPDAVAPQPFALPTSTASGGATFTLPAHSVVVIQMGQK